MCFVTPGTFENVDENISNGHGRINITRFVIVRFQKCCLSQFIQIPDSKVHGTNMGLIWGRQVPGGPHVGPMNLTMWDTIHKDRVNAIRDLGKAIDWCQLRACIRSLASRTRIDIRDDVLSLHLVMSRSHAIGSLSYCIGLKFDMHIGSTAAEVPFKLQSDRTILNTNLAAARSCDKTSYLILKLGPGIVVSKLTAMHLDQLSDNEHRHFRFRFSFLINSLPVTSFSSESVRQWMFIYIWYLPFHMNVRYSDNRKVDSIIPKRSITTQLFIYYSGFTTNFWLSFLTLDACQ